MTVGARNNGDGGKDGKGGQKGFQETFAIVPSLTPAAIPSTIPMFYPYPIPSLTGLTADRRVSIAINPPTQRSS